MVVFLVGLMMLFGVGSASANTFTPRLTASGYQEPNKPDNAIDADLETRWSCKGECWLQMDLGEVLLQDELWIMWRNAEKRTAVFDIELVAGFMSRRNAGDVL